MNSARPEIRQRLNRMLNVGILAPKRARPKLFTPDGNTAAARRMVAGVAVIELRRPPGVKSEIGGRSLNIHCAGEGSPTVILEAPGDGPGYVWAPIQAEIAKFTQVCWYDRAGEGWSDPGPYPQTSATIAKDLHELLPRAGSQLRAYSWVSRLAD